MLIRTSHIIRQYRIKFQGIKAFLKKLVILDLHAKITSLYDIIFKKFKTLTTNKEIIFSKLVREMHRKQALTRYSLECYGNKPSRFVL